MTVTLKFEHNPRGDSIDLKIAELSSVIIAFDTVMAYCRKRGKEKSADALGQLRTIAVNERDEFVAAVEVIRKHMDGMPALLPPPAEKQPAASPRAGTGKEKRPPGIPSNIEMVKAILAGGPMRAADIFAEMRKRWWPEMPTHNISSIYQFAGQGKISRVGANFALKADRVPTSPAADDSDDDEAELKPLVKQLHEEPPPPPPKPAPKPIATAIAPASGGVKFTSNDGETIHLTPREHRLVSKLYPHHRKGLVFPVDTLSREMWPHGERAPHNVKGFIETMKFELNPKLKSIGIALDSNAMGFFLKEI